MKPALFGSRERRPPVGMFMSAPGDHGDGAHHGEYLFYAKQPYWYLREKICSVARRHLARNVRRSRNDSRPSALHVDGKCPSTARS